MTGRATLLLLAVVVAVGSWLWSDAESRRILQGLVHGTPPSPPEQEYEPLVKFAREDLRALELRRDGRRLVVELDGDGGQGPLRERALEDFLDNLKGVGRIQHIDVADDELGDFGLASPARVLVLSQKPGADTIRIDIGNHNPATTAVYTRLNASGPVILAGSVLAWDFDKLEARLGPVADREP